MYLKKRKSRIFVSKKHGREFIVVNFVLYYLQENIFDKLYIFLTSIVSL